MVLVILPQRTPNLEGKNKQIKLRKIKHRSINYHKLRVDKMDHLLKALALKTWLPEFEA